MKKIGVIGTGIMGSGIAANYLKAGYPVTVWNRTAGKTADLQKAGAILAESPKLVTEQSDILFEVTANDESSQGVWQGEAGILAGASSDKALKALIASATLSVDWTLKLNDLCANQGFTFFDMPLTGGRAAAEGGSLILLVGGNEAKLEALKPDLAAISSKIYYFGEAGSGMKYKLVLNSLQAAQLAAFGEAMRLATAAGLDLAKVGPALVDRPGGVVTTAAWEAYQKADIPLTFSVDWITKDLEYVKQMAAGADLPIIDDVLALYHQAQDKGQGNEDWAIINKP